jgi:hypothetical protein
MLNAIQCRSDMLENHSYRGGRLGISSVVHQNGTVRLGTDPASSALDADLPLPSVVCADHRWCGGREVADDGVRVVVDEVFAAVLAVLLAALVGASDEGLFVPCPAHCAC